MYTYKPECSNSPASFLRLLTKGRINVLTAVTVTSAATWVVRTHAVP